MVKNLLVNIEEIISKITAKKAEIQENIRDELSVIIVSTDEVDKLKPCLDSIKRANLRLPCEIIVVDNCSADGTNQFLKKTRPEIKVIENAGKYGYAKNVNMGIKASTTEYCLVLNPDVIAIPGSIEIMLDYLVKHPKVGLIGCKLLNDDGTIQASVRRFLDLRTYLYRFTPLRGLMAGSQLERYYLMQEWNHNENRLVDWVLGGCMLVRRKAFDQVGMMDERFFLYFDDVDWCYEMWEKGWQVAYVADAAMFHKHMRTSANKLFNRATYEHFRSLFLFLVKHGFRLPKNCPSSYE